MYAATAFPLHSVRASEPFSSLLQKRTQVSAKRNRGKAVSWPPEDQICQVRFFLSNDAPSTLGPAQASMQANHLRSLSTQRGAFDTPPGFHGSLTKRTRVDNVLEVSMPIERPWLHPQKFALDDEWLVAVGEEGKEVGLERQRELRVLEAFYPRSTCIPDSPAEPVEICEGLDDRYVLTIPLVPIEEEDENSKEPERELKVLEGNCEPDLATAEHGNLIDDQKPVLPSSGVSPPRLPSMQELSKRWQESSTSTMDPKFKAAAAAAAACLAVHKFGANGLVDQELLVEILRNPALLNSLTILNQSPKDLAVAMNGNVGTVGQPDMNQHNAVNQACQKVPLNAGLPSPVSVLSDWTEEHPSKLFARMPSDMSNRQNFANVSSSMPLKHSYGSPSSREDVAQLESAPVHRVHACTRDTEMGSHLPIASTHMMPVVHADRACGMMPPLGPFLSQNGVNLKSNGHGRMQPAQVVKSPQNGVMHHQNTPILDRAPCRSSFLDARCRGMQYENSNKSGPKTTRLCMYFNTPRGCRYGGSCSFLHQTTNPELNSTAQ